jgi:hypothetical protein
LSLENLTAAVTASTAVDGTVNRFYFKIVAGPGETCKNIHIRFSSITNSNPSNSKASCREAMLIVEGATDAEKKVSACASGLPNGWTSLPLERATKVCEKLDPLESHMFYVDFYRPTLEVAVDPESLLVDKCMTDYNFELSYDQSRLSSAGAVENNKGDLVKYSYSGKVEWTSPVMAEFSESSAASKDKVFPCGSQLPVNKTTQESAEPATSPQDNLNTRAVNGETLSLACILSAPNGESGLVPRILAVTFALPSKDTSDASGSCSVELVNQTKNDLGSINPQTADTDPLCRILAMGSKLTASCNMKVSHANLPSRRIFGTTAELKYMEVSLGNVEINWSPVPLHLSESETQGNHKMTHGPLQLETHNPILLRAPQCIVESVPFLSGLKQLPHICKVASPFKVTYWVTNKTPLHQKLTILLDDSSRNSNASSDDPTASSRTSDDVLVSGLVNGHILIGPHETTTFGYTALALRAGRVKLPSLNVSSDRYKSWVIREAASNFREVYVLP